ncbi:MAG: phosphatidate cytidylyltransferase [Cyanobacteria bacterium P01_F01_bin.116]
MDNVNPLFFPLLYFLGSATLLSIVLASLLSIMHRDDPDKVKKTIWMKLAILLTLVLILIGTGSLGKWGLLPVVLFLAYWGWRELLQCIEQKYGRVSSSILITGLGILGVLGGLGETLSAIFWSVIIASWAAFALPMLYHLKPPRMHSILGTALGMMLITIPLAILLAMVNTSYGEFSLLVFLVMGNDGFSQGVGLMLGKTPLVPSISPGKTLEGSLGGLFACLVLGYLSQFLVPEWHLWQVLLVSGTVSLLSQCGDLLTSSLKREAGIKDFGHVLLVTGGVLDKFDSLLFTIPIYWFICQCLARFYVN